LKAEPDQGGGSVANRIVLVLLLGWLGFNWWSTVVHIIRYYNPLPVSDYWRVIEDLPVVQAGRLSWLWRQHNEHRIVFPEIVFVLDHLAFRGREVLPLLVSFACYVGALILLGRNYWRHVNASTPVKMQALLLGGVIAGWPLSVYVLGTPFLLQWTLLQFAVVLALDSVSRFRDKSGFSPVALCIASAVVATYSSANGLLLWLILLGIGVAMRAPRNRLLALAFSGAISVGAYFVGYDRPGTPLLAALRHPIYCLGFVVSYFSMPFGALRLPVFGLIFGLVSLTVWLTCFGRAFRDRRRSISAFDIVAFGYFAFVLLTAVLTSIGRVNVADRGFGNAKATRYLTFPLLGWALMVALATALSWREKWKTFSTQVIVLTAMVIVGFMQIRLGRWLRTNTDYVAFQQWSAVSLQNDLLDPFFLGSVFPKQAFIEHFVPILRAGGASVFADPAVKLPGKQFRSAFPNSQKEAEPGGVGRITPVRGGLSVLGWAANLDRGGKNLILFVDGAGEIVGLGRHLRAGFPKELMPLPAPSSQTWVGFINGRYRSRSFIPYLVEPESGFASPLARDTNIPGTNGTVPAL
jgi:hypothetical protein